MKFSSTLSLVLAAAGTTMGAAIKRASYTDVDILNFALTLEHLEDKFYREGLKNYTQAQFASAGFDATFYQNLKEVSFDETTHVSFLTSALKAAGAPAVAECTYSFGVTSVAGFVGLASVLEGVGVSAYLGAAASISTKAYLTAAASILTVESRHNAYIRAAIKASPFPQPFDAPLDVDEVYTLAKQFIVKCPDSNPAFSKGFLAAFPVLSVTGPTPIKTGSTVTLTAKGTKSSKYNPEWDTGKAPVYAAWAAVTGSVFVQAKPKGNKMFDVVVPAGFHGQSYVVLTCENSNSADANIIAGPAIVEISGTTGSP